VIVEEAFDCLEELREIVRPERFVAFVQGTLRVHSLFQGSAAEALGLAGRLAVGGY
jgi:hypothetical protein